MGARPKQDHLAIMNYNCTYVELTIDDDCVVLSVEHLTTIFWSADSELHPGTVSSVNKNDYLHRDFDDSDEECL